MVDIPYSTIYLIETQVCLTNFYFILRNVLLKEMAIMTWVLQN